MGKFSKILRGATVRWGAIAILTLCSLLILPRLFEPISAPSPHQAGSYAKLTFSDSIRSSLQVDSERLWHYLINLPAERFEERDRQATRQYITQTLEDAGWAVRQQLFTVKDGDNEQTGINLIATYPELAPSFSLNRKSADASVDGSNRTLVIGAHYDTVQGSAGADDNGTGVAAILELAQLLSPNHLEREIERSRERGEDALALNFVLFDLEESGLWGSEAFVADIAEQKDIAGAIILEMLGYTCQQKGCQTYPPLPIPPPSEVGDFLAVVGDRNHPHLVERFQFSQASIPIYTLTIPTLGPLTPDLLRSDHVPFWRRGMGAVMVTDTANFRNPHYHQASDRPATLDPDFFASATQAILEAITHQEMS